MELRIWIRDVGLRMRMDSQTWTNLEIWRRFKSHAIVIPFPQRDLHIISPQGSP